MMKLYIFMKYTSKAIGKDSTDYNTQEYHQDTGEPIWDPKSQYFSLFFSHPIFYFSHFFLLYSLFLFFFSSFGFYFFLYPHFSVSECTTEGVFTTEARKALGLQPWYYHW